MTITPQDQQFAQNQKLISLLEEMKRHEYISVDPIAKSNLRRQLVGGHSSRLSPPLDTIEIDPRPKILAGITSKLKFALKLAPTLLLAFVVVFSIKKFYIDSPTGDPPLENAAEESIGKTPLSKELRGNPSSALSIPQGKSPDGKGPRDMFVGFSMAEERQIRRQILSRLESYKHEIAGTYTIKTLRGLIFQVRLASGERYRVYYVHDNGAWKAIKGEEY